MTTQEAYEKMREWFLTDQRFGFNLAQRECEYQTPTGARCAVGCLIPDDNPMLNATGDVNDLAQEWGYDFASVFSGVDFDFLRRAQLRHDDAAANYATIEVFINQLDDLAREYDLQVPA